MSESIYDLTFTDNAGNRVDLAHYRGRPMLIVNTASKCGFTPQYAGLQELHERFVDEGLAVIGFPCDQFAHQEPGDDSQIAEFCQLNYGVSFPLASKIEVNGKKAHPVFQFLTKRTRGLLGGRVRWNFTKFLVGADGVSIRRYGPTIKPSDIVADIQQELAKRDVPGA